MSRLPNLEDPKQAAARAATEKLVQRHFPRARRSGNGWSGFCPAHEDRHRRSLSIGVGDGGRLLLHCFKDCSFASILEAAGLNGIDVSNLTAPARQSPAERIAAARAIWEKSGPLVGTVAETDLGNRGITIRTPTLRFVRLRPTELREFLFPALTVEIQNLEGAFIGVQITYLANDGSGKVPAFLGVTPRKIFGQRGGGAVRLAAAANRLAISEGVETGLSIMQATGIPTWATLGCGGMKSIVLPPSVREVIICADNDPPGVSAAECARQRFVRENRRARVVLPPKGSGDFNEVLM